MTNTCTPTHVMPLTSTWYLLVRATTRITRAWTPSILVVVTIAIGFPTSYLDHHRGMGAHSTCWDPMPTLDLNFPTPWSYFHHLLRSFHRLWRPPTKHLRLTLPVLRSLRPHVSVLKPPKTWAKWSKILTLSLKPLNSISYPWGLPRTLVRT